MALLRVLQHPNVVSSSRFGRVGGQRPGQEAQGVPQGVPRPAAPSSHTHFTCPKVPPPHHHHHVCAQVRFVDEFYVHERLFIVMEHVPCNLLELLEVQSGGMESEAVRLIIYQLCSAVAFIHSKVCAGLQHGGLRGWAHRGAVGPGPPFGTWGPTRGPALAGATHCAPEK